MNALQGQLGAGRPFETATIRLGRRLLEVQVASTPEQWARGMAGRPDIDAMLFVMPPGSQYPFQMRNVDHDLLIAFFNEAGQVVDLGVMPAHVGFKHAATPYTYALEVKPEGEDFTILSDIADGITLE